MRYFVVYNTKMLDNSKLLMNTSSSFILKAEMTSGLYIKLK